MEESLGSRLKHAWNAFMNRDPTGYYQGGGSSFYSHRPDRVRLTRGNERTIITAMYNRIALDVASIDIRHIKTDEEDRFVSYVNSGLDNCLTVEANMDQTGTAFIHDVVLSMLDEGVVAIVPVDTTLNPVVTGSYDILSMRVAKIIEWRPEHVKVKLYNDRTGNKEEIWLPKKTVAIIENPLYAVINEPNSTMQRLIRKLALLDGVDDRTSTGKLDMIIQLPYLIKTEARRKQADERMRDIESQLTNNPLGIAYIDGTEKVTQLNRPIENNLLKQIEYLTSMAFAQLGFHQSILDNTADEKTMHNYIIQIVEPIVTAIVDELKRKFLTKTARSQHQTIAFFRDPFKLIPAGEFANVADTLTRNEIASKNEIRQKMGWKPSDDPKADQLINSNISQPTDVDPNQAHEDPSMMPEEDAPVEEY